MNVMMCMQHVCYVRRVVDIRGMHSRYEARCENASVCTPEMYQGEVCDESNGIETCNRCVPVQCNNISGEMVQRFSN